MKRLSAGVLGGVAGLAVAWLAGGVLGQPGTGGGGGREGAERRPTMGEPMDAEMLRSFIDRRIEEGKASIARLEEARKKLASGGDAAAIGRELLEGMRDRRFGNRREGVDVQVGTAAGGSAGGQAQPAGERAPRPMDLGALLGGPRLSQDERAKALASLKEKHPLLLGRIEQFSAGDQSLKDRFVDGVSGKLKWIEGMREKSPQESDLRMTELEHGLEILRLGREVVEAKRSGKNEGEVAALRGQLRVQMEAAFDTRQAISRLQIEQLKKRAESLERALDKKHGEKGAEVDRQTDELVQRLEGARVQTKEK